MVRASVNDCRTTCRPLRGLSFFGFGFYKDGAPDGAGRRCPPGMRPALELKSPNRFHPPDIDRFYLGQSTVGEEFDALVLFLRIDHAADADSAIIGEDFED